MAGGRGVGKLVIIAGLALLAVTGYQATTYREHLRLTQQPFEGLPAALLAQLVVAVAVCAVGGLQFSGTFLPIRVSDVPKSIVMRPQRNDFVVFRGRAGPPTPLPGLENLPEVPEIR